MKNHSAIYFMAVSAIFAALMCIFGPLSVPIGPVPVSLTGLVIYLSLEVIGMKRSLVSLVIYLLLGAFGMPVFSGGGSGIAKIVGPTGGYLVGFLVMVMIAGIIMEKTNYNIIMTFLGMVLGTAVLYAFGTAWFCFVAKAELGYALSVCVYPFILVDLGKMIVAVLVGSQIRKALIRAKLL